MKTVGITRTVEKYKSRTAVAGADYIAGVSAPKNPWASQTQAAATNYQTAVQAGDIGARFSAGVANAGDGKWSAMAKAKGPTRYSAGVALGAPYFQSGMTENLGVIEGISWVRPGPSGSPGNYAIVTQIGDALHAMKVGRT